MMIQHNNPLDQHKIWQNQAKTDATLTDANSNSNPKLNLTIAKKPIVFMLKFPYLSLKHLTVQQSITTYQ